MGLFKEGHTVYEAPEIIGTCINGIALEAGARRSL
jgi:hypothetical protein